MSWLEGPALSDGVIFKKCNKVQDMCVEDGDASSRGRRAAESVCEATPGDAELALGAEGSRSSLVVKSV